MNEEYEALRAEINSWQERRFTVLSWSATIVTAILGLEVTKSSGRGTWPLIASLLLVLLSCASALTCYAGRTNAKISAYLQVFHEPGWERRLARFSERSAGAVNVNHLLAVAYLVLGGVSTVVPCVASASELPQYEVSVLLVSTWFLLACSLVAVAFFSYPRETYKSQWEQIRNEETTVDAPAPSDASATDSQAE